MMITVLIICLLCGHAVVCIKNYDYIIVGSGSAGSVVAKRLSEDPSIKVLLLEAGVSTPNLLSTVPLFSEELRVSPYSWNYTTVPLKNAGYGLINKVSIVPRGKVLGGTSTINGNLYTRGNKNDYNMWAAHGAIGWDWEGVFPYFFKHEDNGDSHMATNGYHNVGGDQPINFPPFFSPMAKAYLEAAELLGYETADFNGENQAVFNIAQGTIKEGRRWSGLKSFLEPIMGRRNIEILTSAHVTRILISSNRKAYGVLFDQNNESHQATAKEEVILCAGVFNSPQLLMLSGIGPKKELDKLGIPVIADLPVGENLQDHLATNGLLFKTGTYTARKERLTKDDYNDFLSMGIGPLTTLTGTEVVGFIKSNRTHLDYPDIEIFWSSVPTVSERSSLRLFFNGNRALWKAFEPYTNMDVVTCYTYILQPKSIGKVWLSSTDPYRPPVIDPNYYSHPDDIKLMIKGMKFCLELASQEPMKRRGVQPIPLELPECKYHRRYSDEHLSCVAKVAIESINHFVGTCKMGDPEDPTTVVDPLLRVKGIHSLRVVDSSIMPIIISGHTHGPTVMIGEKGAHLILQDLQRRRKLKKSDKH